MSGELDFSPSASWYACRALSQSRSAIACRACWQSASMLCGVAISEPPTKCERAQSLPASPFDLVDDGTEGPELVQRCESLSLRLLCLRVTGRCFPPRSILRPTPIPQG